MKLEKIINYLLIIFLFILPWQSRYIFLAGNLKNEYWEYGTLALYASDAILVIILLLAIINYCLKKTRAKLQTSTIWLIILSSAALLINVYFSLNKLISLRNALWFIMAVGIFIILKNTSLKKSLAVLIFVISASLSGLLGLWQFVAQNSFASTILGLAKHDPTNLGVSVIEAIAPDGIIERWLRAYGSLDHPNIFAGLMMAGLIFSLYFIITGQNTDKKNIFIMAALVALTGGLATSFSRAGWLATVISILIFMIYSIKNQQIKSKEVWSFFIISFITISLLIIPYYYIFTPRISFDSRLEKISTEERYAGYKESWSIIKQYPILGSGLGTYGIALEKINSEKTVWFYQPVHNIFILILSEAGLIGVILSIFAIYLIIKKSITDNKALVVSLLCGLLILGIFDHWLISLHFGFLFMATVLGLALNKKSRIT